ncbi:MAG: hypothetical protein C4K49_06390 [Candidatus Thorarchaeota archaeon]|nr:MAG: hypothetical protein C4K49_06390 [Candidatus Thorarchaeota archaeon]
MANDGIVVVQDSRIVMINPALAKMLEYNESDLVGAAFESVLDPVATHLFQEKQEGFAFGEQSRSSFRARFLTGKNAPLNVEVSTADFIFDGRPAIVVVARNIDQQLELEAAVEQSEIRYKKLYESSPIAYFTLSPRGIIQGVNSAAERLLGYPENELLRRGITSFLPSDPTDTDTARQLISEVLEGHSIKDREMRLRNADGESVWVSISSSVLPEDDKSTTIALMVIDITHRKEAEEQESIERERANLYLEVMTHDLNNCNQTLLFTLGLIEASPDFPGDLRPLVTQSTWNVKRAARMVANLRLLMAVHENPPIKEKTDPFGSLQRAISSVRQDFPWKQITLRSDLKPGEFYVAAHTYFDLVFFNIVHNSAMHDERDDIEVEVQCEESDHGDSVRFEFLDKGPGIPDSLKEFIFKRTGSPTIQIVGRGLGLTVADAITKQLGGKVWVEDRVKGRASEGARFVVVVPSWREPLDLPCGKNSCITFYKSNHCLFCEPAFEILMGLVQEFGLPSRSVEVVNVDDPSVSVSENDVPVVPLIRLCGDHQVSGFVSDDQLRTALMGLMVKPCYPYNR